MTWPIAVLLVVNISSSHADVFWRTIYKYIWITGSGNGPKLHRPTFINKSLFMFEPPWWFKKDWLFISESHIMREPSHRVFYSLKFQDIVQSKFWTSWNFADNFSIYIYWCEFHMTLMHMRSKCPVTKFDHQKPCLSHQAWHRWPSEVVPELCHSWCCHLSVDNGDCLCLLVCIRWQHTQKQWYLKWWKRPH